MNDRPSARPPVAGDARRLGLSVEHRLLSVVVLMAVVVASLMFTRLAAMFSMISGQLTP